MEENVSEKFSSPQNKTEENEEIIRVLEEKLRAKYNMRDSFPRHFYKQLVAVRNAFGGLKNVRGKKILDIGCGSIERNFKARGVNDSEDRIFRDFEPWLCRALQELGANPVGIDIMDLEIEEFEHYQLDFLEPKALNFFVAKSFDGVNISCVFGPFDDLIIKNPIDASNKKNIMKMLGEEIKKLLKNDAKFINIIDANGFSLRQSFGL